MSYKNTYTSVSASTKTAYPVPVTKAGTISCASGLLVVTGTGTNFQQDIIPGDFIYNEAATNGEVRKVTSVSQNHSIELSELIGGSNITTSISTNTTDGVNGAYSATPLTGGSGVGATAEVEVSGLAVTSIIVDADAKGYKAGDVLEISTSVIGGTTNVEVTLEQANIATGNTVKIYEQLLTIDSSFSTVLSGADFDVIKTDIRKLSISNNHATDAIKIDGVDLAAGDTINVDREGPNGVADSFIDPVAVNTGTGTAVVLVIK